LLRIARTPADLLKCHVVRGIVFVEEQGVPYDLEIDEHEATALHVLWEEDGEPVATGRVRFLDDWAKLERIAVRRAWRGRGRGERIVERLLELARERGHHRFKLHAQAHLRPYYERLGFAVQGELFQEADIDHYLMVREE
jgi:predicted GNAT family N-acyltransferase